MTTTDSTLADVGVTGLATMGRNLARNFASRGHTVAVHNRTPGRVERLFAEHGDEGRFIGAGSLSGFVASLRRPRVVVLMVRAGDATDETIDQLVPWLAPGDIVVDAGNSHYLDTQRREARLRACGLGFLGVGVSGGEQGALLGPSIMPGGERDAYAHVGPLLDSIAARVDGAPCSAYVGPAGAGHFVKMVHNGIEYADMQLIAETYDVLRTVLGADVSEIATMFRSWQGSELDGFLVDITVQALEAVDEHTDRPFVDVISDQAGMKGTGLWTVQAALALGVNVGSISEAVAARMLSSRRPLPASAPDRDTLAGGRRHDAQALTAAARSALYAAKVAAYAQGFDLIGAASREYGWEIDLAGVASAWRGGCIIRAALLDDIRAAYTSHPTLPSLLADPALAANISSRMTGWRAFVNAAVAAGIPVPVMASTLSYFDSLQAARLPTALIQAQRDIFGAHTYQRVDRDGSFHRDWAGDGRERLVTG